MQVRSQGLRRLVSPVFFSRAADGSLQRGLGSLPDSRPLLLVGNHQARPRSQQLLRIVQGRLSCKNQPPHETKYCCVRTAQRMSLHTVVSQTYGAQVTRKIQMANVPESLF